MDARKHSVSTLNDLRSLACRGSEQIGKRFTNPNDDWAPVMLVQTPTYIRPVVLGVGAFDEKHKPMIAQVLREIVREEGAVRYAFVASAWSATAADLDTVEQIRAGELKVKDAPGAEEILVCSVGDAESEQVWICPVHRHEDRPPTLGTWTRQDNRPDYQKHTGRFANIGEALRSPRREP